MTSRDDTQTSAVTLRRAYLAIEHLQGKLDELERAKSEPIAIVGIGCRFPGGVVDADTFWEVLRTGTDALTEIPADRWDVDAFYDSAPQRPGKMIMRTGGFLDRVDVFDHEFFGISRREANAMDPQQRLTLEVAWEALENSGHSPAALAGSRTGVFAGVCTSDFAVTQFRHPLDVTAYASTGTAHSAVPGRVSYALDLKGPSLAIDTACSSSLVAVHLACQSLRAGECDLALGGGVNVILSPMTSIAYSQFPGMVSPDGRCKTFDAAADGSIPSEGCGFVVLKRLSDAVRDDNHVLAVLRGTAVNQDGRSSGLTAPSGLAQQAVIRRALEVGGVNPGQVGYVEAHGSGTPLGDPIEVEALAEVYGHQGGAPVYLGTAKTNIGHLQAAAGVAGLIKVALSLDRGVIPPNLNFQRLNPDISFDGTTFAVPTELTPWPAPEGHRFAGVSSFGFSGTNAHLIVADPPRRAPAPADTRRPVSVLALSAKTPTALARLASRYAARLRDDDRAAADVCFSANTGRSHFTHRLAAVARTTRQLADQLDDFTSGLPGDEPAVGQAGEADVVFLCTGQGSQRPGMADELYQTQPTFQREIDRCDDIVRPILGIGLKSALYPQGQDPGLLNRPAYAQPALFAVEYAMAELWRSWGVEPVAVLGHSLGEYVAACIAGAMTLEDSLMLVAERGRLMETLTGTMAAVFAPERQVADAIAELGAQVWIAAVNGPANTVISGNREPVASVCAALDARGVRTKQLHVTNSGHSALVEPILPELRQAADRVRFTAPRIALVSNVTGEVWPWEQAPDAEYWCLHARQPVRFAAGVAALTELGYRNFLEIGPAPTLLGLISDARLAEGDSLLLPSLRPKEDDWQVLAAAVAQLYVHGADVDWTGFDRDYQRTKVALPTYPFAQTRCWQQSPSHIDAAQGTAEALATAPVDPDPVDGSAPEPDELDDADLLYRLEWQQAEVENTPSAPDNDARTWLIFADEVGVGSEVASALVAQGRRCVQVRAGAGYRYDSAREATVRPGEPRDLRRLVGDLNLPPEDRLEVVYLWGIRDDDEQQESAERQLSAQMRACGGAIAAVQALAGTGSALRASLWLATRGAVQPDSQTVAPLALSQSTLWGLGRSLQQEHPGIWGGLVDLDPQAALPSAAASLLREIDGQGSEDQIALRGQDRYVARLARTQLDDGQATRAKWRKDASYLITGGLTGIGLEVAKSMARAGVRRLVLIGRTPLPPRSQWAGIPADSRVGRRVASIRELESLGASVMPESFDISDEAAARAFLERYDREGWPPIRGVVHSAGIADVAPLLEVSADDLERHLRPKSAGAWVLHRLFTNRPLDHFVLFGSASSILSSPFTATYAAANAFLDSLAKSRRNAGQPALTIGWGLWLGTGMAERKAEPDAEPKVGAGHQTGSVRAGVRLSSGMGGLRPAQGIRMFHRLLGCGQSQVAVVPIDLPTWGVRYQEASRSQLLARLLAGSGATAAGRGRAKHSMLPTRAALLGLPEAERVSLLGEQLSRSVAATLDADPAAIRPEQPLVDLGFDSLMAVELRNEIEGQLNVFLPVSAFLAEASIKNLTDHVMELLDGPDGGAGASAGPGPAITRVRRADDLAAELLDQLDSLSDKEAQMAVHGDEQR